ncbi:hypothetical protein BASA81_015312 [Batrachochytrium salamandrivorans]|nr:hypothetical protein BASA81_015312 [Batrachochytrium salamandrivorans]
MLETQSSATPSPTLRNLGCSLTIRWNSEKLPRVHHQLELVFQLHPIGTTRSKDDCDSRYSSDGNALAWYNPYLEKPHLYEYDSLLAKVQRKKLRVTFGEVNQAQSSEFKLRSLRQEINPALSMWLCFNQLTADLDSAPCPSACPSTPASTPRS